VTWLARLYLWATYRLYDELAWAYDVVSWLVSLGRWSGWRKSALDYVTGDRILEIGFGTGELLIEMAQRGMNVVGLDLSQAMHRVTARKLVRQGVEVPRTRGIVQSMPFSDGQFDSIVSTFPAGYILAPETLREVARLLRPPDPVTGAGGGRFVVVGMVVWREGWLWRRAVQLLFGGGGEFASGRFERLARAAGLQVEVSDQVEQGWHVPVIVAKRGPLARQRHFDREDERGGERDGTQA
jgi:SAM-dependent methyltransferase